jgi:hypothetical protein
MSGEHHEHHHHHHGPLEAIDHVHGGPMVLDIGGSIGALHVVLDEAWAGRELHLGSERPGFTVHTGVWLRHVDGRHVATALFPALEAGTYHISVDGYARAVRVEGGAVTELDLSAAAPAGTAR